MYILKFNDLCFICSINPDVLMVMLKRQGQNSISTGGTALEKYCSIKLSKLYYLQVVDQ